MNILNLINLNNQDILTSNLNPTTSIITKSKNQNEEFSTFLKENIEKYSKPTDKEYSNNQNKELNESTSKNNITTNKYENTTISTNTTQTNESTTDGLNSGKELITNSNKRNNKNIDEDEKTQINSKKTTGGRFSISKLLFSRIQENEGKIANPITFLKVKEKNKNDLDQNYLHLIPFITSLDNLSKNTELPKELKDKITEIKSKLQNGKVNLNEILSLISELQTLSKQSKEIQKFMQLLENEITNLSNLKELNNILGESNNTKTSSTKTSQTFDNIIVNDFRNKENAEKTKDTLNPLQTPFRIDSNSKQLNLPQTNNINQSNNNFFVQVHNLSNSLNELSGRIVINLKNDVKEMKMTLFPPELGKVFVKFESLENGKLVGNIVVSTREAYTLFQEHLNVIKDNLSNQGFNVFDINLSLDTSGFSGYNKDNNNVMQEIEKSFWRGRTSFEEYEKTLSTTNRTSIDEGIINVYA